jgi:Holliday junction resolvase-like predicted endonuclease
MIELAEAQRRTEERLNELAEAQRRTEEELRELARSQRQMRDAQDRFAQIIGPAVEARMVAAVREWLSQRGYRLLQPIASVPLDGIGEIDGMARAVSPEGEEIWLLVSVKAKVWPRDVKDFAALLSLSATQAALREFGVRGAILPLLFGMVMDYRASQAASEARIGLILEAQGEVVPGQRWMMEEAGGRDRERGD